MPCRNWQSRGSRRLLPPSPGAHPEFADAHNNLGNALVSQEKFDEAATSLRWALELKPDYAEAHVNLSIVFRDQDKLDEAVACFRRASELKPDCAEAMLNLGEMHEDSGEMAEAELALRAAIKMQPTFAPAHACLATLLRGKLPDVGSHCVLKNECSDPQLSQDHRAQLRLP